MLQFGDESLPSLGDNRVVVALYVRTVTAKGRPSKLVIQPIAEPWPECTSWNTQPSRVVGEISIDFEAREGWHLFDITELCQKHPETWKHGILIRFCKGKCKWFRMERLPVCEPRSARPLESGPSSGSDRQIGTRETHRAAFFSAD